MKICEGLTEIRAALGMVPAPLLWMTAYRNGCENVLQSKG